MMLKIGIGKSLMNNRKYEKTFLQKRSQIKEYLLLFDPKVSNSYCYLKNVLYKMHTITVVVVMATAKCLQHNAAVLFV